MDTECQSKCIGPHSWVSTHLQSRVFQLVQLSNPTTHPESPMDLLVWLSQSLPYNPPTALCSKIPPNLHVALSPVLYLPSSIELGLPNLQFPHPSTPFLLERSTRQNRSAVQISSFVVIRLFSSILYPFLATKRSAITGLLPLYCTNPFYDALGALMGLQCNNTKFPPPIYSCLALNGWFPLTHTWNVSSIPCSV